MRAWVSIIASLVAVGAARSARAGVNVTVDASQSHQTMYGFGATTISLSFMPGQDNLTSALRAQAIQALYGDVQLTTGNVNVGPQETPGDYSQQANDDNDPNTFNWSGFSLWSSDAMKAKVIDPGTPLGFTDWYLAGNVSTRWGATWLAAMRDTSYSQYIAECAENALAAQVHWRDAYGSTTPLQMLFNEPTSGNGELAGGSTQDVVDIVKAAGARLRAAGFADVKFVVPGEETEERSLAVATAILADPVARPFVGAIAYHTYPYGSIYSDVNNVLATSGAGAPDAGRVAVRGQLRDLAAQYGVPVFMTEVSHGGVDPRSFDGLRGRAIHIHDELVYADAAAYFGMNNLWDTTAQMEHFGNTSLWDPSNEGGIVVVDEVAQQVVITAMGHAIGHYARWVKRGAVRVTATADDPLVLVTAFRDDARGQFVVVAINNADASRDLAIDVAGLRLAGTVEGEQSTTAAVWQALSPSTAQPGGFTTTVPAMSVTTFRAPLEGGPQNADGGLVSDAAGNAATGKSGGCGCQNSDGSAGGLALIALCAISLRRRPRR